MQLIKNKTYFGCGFPSAGNSFVPVIETYIYVGTIEEVFGIESAEYVFQDADNYFERGAMGLLEWPGLDGDKGVVIVKEENLGLMSDYDELLKFLADCKDRDTSYI